MREGGTVLLSGNKGSGKTTITMRVEPTLFISTEQEIQEVSHIWYRVMGETGVPVPLMTNCYTWEQLQEDLLSIQRGDRVIVDSISQFSTGPESAAVVKAIIEHIRHVGAMAWFIAQYTKAGDMAGPNMLNHMVDVVCMIPDDSLGMRRLNAVKNRFGDLFSRYFALTAKGVVEQDFPWAYTVEGSAGNYHLHLYPMGNAKYAGLFDVMSESGVMLEGMASAAIQCKGYRSGFAEPNEIERRRSFAEEHGLHWITPEEGQQLIQEAIEQQGQTKEM